MQSSGCASQTTTVKVQQKRSCDLGRFKSLRNEDIVVSLIRWNLGIANEHQSRFSEQILHVFPSKAIACDIRLVLLVDGLALGHDIVDDN